MMMAIIGATVAFELIGLSAEEGRCGFIIS